jgi:hypothetical protein
MSRMGGGGSNLEKIALAADGGPQRQGANKQSKPAQKINRSDGLRYRLKGTPLRFVYSQWLRSSLPCFLAGFFTHAWLNFANKPKPPPPAPKKKKKKPPARTGRALHCFSHLAVRGPYSFTAHL